MIKVAIINNTRNHSHFGCSLVMDNLELLLAQNGFSVEWSWPVHKDWRLHQEELLGLAKVDVVIVNGEGTINNSHRKKYAQALVELARFATDNISKYCYLINATLFNNTADAYQQLKYYRSVYVRDQASLAELHRYGCHGKWVPDLTFYGASDHSEKATPAKKVCVTDNTLRPMAKRLKRYARKKGFTYVTMSLAHPRNKPFWKSPRTFLKNTWNWFFRDRHRSSQPQAYIDFLQQFELVITGRFHTVTMCLKHRIPFIAIASNTPKIEHLLEDVFGDKGRSVSIEDIESDRFPESCDFSTAELEKISEFLADTQRKIDSLFASINADFKQGKAGKDFDYL